MSWWDYFKGKLAYDLFWLCVAVVSIFAAFCFLAVVEAVERRKRRRR